MNAFLATLDISWGKPVGKLSSKYEIIDLAAKMTSYLNVDDRGFLPHANLCARKLHAVLLGLLACLARSSVERRDAEAECLFSA